MRNYLIIIVLFLLRVSGHAQNITAFEYFFDTDPGIGLATAANPAASPTVSDFNIPVSTLALSAGFHTLYIRAKNTANEWTHTHFRNFYIVPLSIPPASDITQMEYFVDTDPGIGVATQVTGLTPSAVITNLPIDLNVTSLSNGFHTLYVRTKNNVGEWTHTHFRNFYIVPLSSPPVINITQVEYFVDTDPGVGLATQVTGITPSASISNLPIDVSASSFSPGFHTLYVRSKNSAGEWTHTHFRNFYIVNTGATADNLIKFEYFFDSDPGFDNGTASPIAPPVPSVTNYDIFAIPSSLSVGTHTIYVRGKDSSGDWTQVITGSFMVSAPLPPTITSFTPASGPIGTTVTITGTNFSTTPTNNIVYFGATKATVTASTATQLTVIVPAGATYQPITVNVGGLIGYSAKPFTVTFAGGGTIDPCSFTSQIDLVPGTQPQLVFIGDLDGDGKADLAVTNRISNTLSVFRNTGSIGAISYAPKVDFTTGALPQSVSIDDLDGDGKGDLAVTNTLSNTISIFLNTSSAGNITYAPKVDFTTGDAPISVFIGDFDGDGKADLAVANRNDNTVSILRNTSSVGSIGFAPKVDFTAGTTPTSVSIGDLDGDGKTDLVVANASSNTVSIFRNTSSAGIISFAAKVDFTTGLNPLAVSFGDFDGDGKGDLAVANHDNGSGNTVSVLRNTSSGAGNIGYAAKVDFTTGIGPSAVSVGDLDGDGRADLAVTNFGSNNVSILRNTSSVGSISYSAKVDFTTGTLPTSVSIGDLDGDGKADLAVANRTSNTVSVFRNTVSSLVPTIASFSSSSGSIGSTVIITGTNFDPIPVNNIVKFNSITATVTASTATSITTTVPTGATTGTISVQVECNTATSSTNFIINEIPAGANGTVTLNEDINFAFASANFVFNDSDGTFGGIQITSLETAGDLEYNGVDVTVGTLCTDVTLLVFNPVTDANGSAYASFDFKVRDNIGALSAAAYTMTVNVNAVNDAPIISSQLALSTPEASALTIGITDLIITDPDNTVFALAVQNGTNYTRTGNTITPNVDFSGLLSVPVTVNDGVVNSSVFNLSVTVVANACIIPGSPVGTGGQLCGSGSISLSASGATGLQGYRWYDTSTGGSLLASTSGYTTSVLTGTTIYYVSVFEPAGSCESPRTAVTATITSLPSAPTTAGASSCSSSSLTLSATDGTSGQYRWYTIASGGTAISGEVNSTYTTPIISISTNYYVAINNGACESARTVVTAIINTQPSAPTTTSASGCTSTAFTLTASGGTNGQYRWYTVATGGVAIAGQVNNTFTTPVLTATTSYFVSIDNGSCESTRTAVTTTIHTAPTAPVTTSASGCAAATITLSASGGMNGQYRWYNVATGGSAISGQVNNTFTISSLTATATYYVSINNGTCESPRTSVTATLQTCIANQPPTIAPTTVQAPVEGKVAISLTALLSDPDNNLDLSTLNVIVQPLSGASAFIDVQHNLILDYSGISFSGTEKLTIEVCDLLAACTQKEISIDVAGDIIVYNGMSPNDDNKNDLFYIQYIDVIEATKKNRVFIFNRWGDLLFNVTDYDNKNNVFRGLNNNGNEIPSGIYFYKIEFESGKKTQSGYLALKR